MSLLSSPAERIVKFNRSPFLQTLTFIRQDRLDGLLRESFRPSYPIS